MQLPGFELGAAQRKRNVTWSSLHCSHLQTNPFVKVLSTRLNNVLKLLSVSDLSAACGVRSEVEG